MIGPRVVVPCHIAGLHLAISAASTRSYARERRDARMRRLVVLVLPLVLPLVLLAGCTDGTGGPPADGAADGTTDDAPAGGVKGATDDDGGAAASPAAPATTTPKAGTASGRVTDAAGKPIEGAVIYVQGTTYEGGEEIELDARSKADGTYSLRLPPGRYHVFGDVNVDFQGETYSYDLLPKDGDDNDQDSDEGVVEDLVWRATGLRSPQLDEDDESSYIGASIQVWSPYWYQFDTGDGSGQPDIPDGSVTTLTLTPKGPAIDGTTPKPKVASIEWPSPAVHAFMDIPVGVYALTGTITLPDGTEHPLTLSTYWRPYGGETESEPASTSPEVRFPPNEYPVSGAADANAYIIDW